MKTLLRGSREGRKRGPGSGGDRSGARSLAEKGVGILDGTWVRGSAAGGPWDHRAIRLAPWVGGRIQSWQYWRNQKNNTRRKEIDVQ